MKHIAKHRSLSGDENVWKAVIKRGNKYQGRLMTNRGPRLTKRVDTPEEAVEELHALRIYLRLGGYL